MLKLVPLLFVLLAVAATVFMMWERHDMAKANIIGHLKRLRAQDIRIAFDWGDFDRDTFTYDVSFTFPDGRRHRDRAKVATRMGAGGDVFWERGIPRGE